MVAKASSLGADLVVDYTICHHNWQYSFLCPTDDEIVEAYNKAYGDKANESDVQSDGDSDSEAEGDDEDEDEGENGDAEMES